MTVVPPVAFCLRLCVCNNVCVFLLCYLSYQLTRPHPGTRGKRETQVRDLAEGLIELLIIVCTVQTWKYLKEITFSVNRHNPAFHCKFENAQA